MSTVQIEPIYSWRPGYRGPQHVAAQKVGHVLTSLAGEHHVRDVRVLRPEVVVEAARPVESPLHPLFEWDDSVAAEQWRREQARYICRHVTVQRIESNEKPRFAFVHVASVGGYAIAEDVAVQPVLKDEALRQAESYLDGARRRLREIARIEGAQPLVRQFLSDLQQDIADLETVGS
jgi:hypothetical protein